MSAVCDPGGVSIVELRAADAPWAAELMAERRELYETYSPVFWRPRAGVTARHAGFLARQVVDATNLALRNPHGFLIAQRRGEEGFVDDFAVRAPGTWDADGRALLAEAWRRLAVDGSTVMRVVTAMADEPKVRMLRAGGLSLAERWWVLPVTARAEAEAGRGRIAGPGFSGLLGPAPPVYDPGGPVLLVDRPRPGTEPGAVARAASQAGAVLAIVAAPPAGELARALAGEHWSVASEWYVGEPRPG